MIVFKFYSFFGVRGTNNKIEPNRQEEAYRGFSDNNIIFAIKGVNGYVKLPQPHITNFSNHLLSGETQIAKDVVIQGKCTEAHAKMILEFISGKKWQSRIKKAYSARNRWVDGKPV